MRRTRGGYLHPVNRLRSSISRIGLSKASPATLNIKPGPGPLDSGWPNWTYTRLIPLDPENIHKQNDFSTPGDVDSAENWTIDRRYVGSGEAALARKENYNDWWDPEIGWIPYARMTTGDGLGDYITYQSNYETLFFPPFTMDTEVFWAGETHFGMTAGESSGVVNGEGFVGWTEEIQYPGTGESFDFANGFGWYVSNGEVHFEIRTEGVVTGYMNCTDLLGGEIQDGDLLKLGAVYGRGAMIGPAYVMKLRIAKFDQDTGMTEYEWRDVEWTEGHDGIMPEVILRTTLGVINLGAGNVNLDMRFYKYLMPAYFTT